MFAARPLEPDWGKLNWQARQVFALNPRRFSVFGPAAAASRIAEALTQRGMTVDVNPSYHTIQFQRQPNRGGGAGIEGSNTCEDIYANTIVLPGDPLDDVAWKRGVINRPITDDFPGPGRSYIQWADSTFQAGWQNIFAFGDLDAAQTWLLNVIAHAPVVAGPIPLALDVSVHAGSGLSDRPQPRQLVVDSQISLYDTPVGVDASPDGSRIYVLLHGGEVDAYDTAGHTLWSSRPLIEGGALAISPDGTKVAVAGYPGLLLLDAATGKAIGGYQAPPEAHEHSFEAPVMISVAWNGAGNRVAGGWIQQDAKVIPPVVLLNADGKVLPAPQGITGGVMGVSFIPGTATLLAGADRLYAIDAMDSTVLWSVDVLGAQTFCFSSDGKTGACGGWGKKLVRFNLADGALIQSVSFNSIIGGSAFLPDGSVAVAAWGGTRPLYRVRPDSDHPDLLFQSRYGFQTVAWLPEQHALAAAEEGGAIWLLSPEGKAIASLDDDSGTTVYRLVVQGRHLLVGRMNRVVQQIGL
jgi:hypothetical protein